MKCPTCGGNNFHTRYCPAERSEAPQVVSRPQETAGVPTRCMSCAAQVELEAATLALKESGIVGIFDEFRDLPDAIQQMALHIKELEQRGAPTDAVTDAEVERAATIHFNSVLLLLDKGDEALTMERRRQFMRGVLADFLSRRTSAGRRPLVHNHGPEDGPGLACREVRQADGSLLGECWKWDELRAERLCDLALELAMLSTRIWHHKTPSPDRDGIAEKALKVRQELTDGIRSLSRRRVHGDSE